MELIAMELPPLKNRYQSLSRKSDFVKFLLSPAGPCVIRNPAGKLKLIWIFESIANGDGSNRRIKKDCPKRRRRGNRGSHHGGR
jgi:hypothetical protein